MAGITPILLVVQAYFLWPLFLLLLLLLPEELPSLPGTDEEEENYVWKKTCRENLEKEKNTGLIMNVDEEEEQNQ